MIFHKARARPKQKTKQNNWPKNLRLQYISKQARQDSQKRPIPQFEHRFRHQFHRKAIHFQPWPDDGSWRQTCE
jgi:hypothetical protein